ncbi:serine hydrolase domain-containing protein [Microbacterium sp. PA5]|uniref:serine hydrolase domain-containing protein n=1 Tax=Microbacterium sp. PA5 TaxID=3416654 RepID=UPI003CF23FF9
MLTVAVLGMTACAPGTSVDLDPIPQVDGALPGEMQEQLQSAVQTAMAATGSTGAIVEVRAPWSGVWTQALGTTTPEGPAVSADMRFRIGPVTRTMTCDVLYGMAARGIVSVDDALGDWLTGYPSLATITLGQLCDGTSGLGVYAGEISSRWYINPPRVWAPKELVAYGVAKGVAGEPGAAYRDSDTGYLLLGLALERAAGASAAELFSEYVFEPLGMDSSSLPSTTNGSETWLNGLRSGDTKGRPDCAAPADLTSLSPTTAFTAGGAVSTVGDLSDYIQSVALGARSYDVESRFADPLPISSDAPSWFTVTGGAFQAGSLVGSSGAVPGYLTAAYADTETGLSVVVVLNNSRAGSAVPRQLAWQLAALASKAPAAEGQSAPEAGGLPWEAATFGDAIVDDAICPLP